eukprot:TRINITY_DN80524_c0_g1_i1.p1 TRINITY_DN80524_c0_g1~~TRINITY_DN80524_c0_g1_i1.p1  ORF type:complete len:226 (+),score=12.61 TRINITY_DN80524_c0_g1_i1:183-860(+)
MGATRGSADELKTFSWWAMDTTSADDLTRSLSLSEASTSSGFFFGVAATDTPTRASDVAERSLLEESPQLPNDYPRWLVVRNTFLDVRSSSPSRRRARSAEPLGRLPYTQNETGIVNVGVSGERSDLPFAARPSAVVQRGSSERSSGPFEAGHLTEPLPAEVPQGELPLPSIGSVLHMRGGCVPCGYFWTPRSCRSGANCLFCHLCDAGEKRRRRVQKKIALRCK